MPVFEENILKQMKIEDLKNVYQRWNIRQGNHKDQDISNIVSRSTAIHQQYNHLESLKKSIETQWNPIPAPPHFFYHSHFNLIDLLDRKWNSVEEHHHQNHHWKYKMMLAILRFALLNVWVYVTKIKFNKWKH